MARTAVVGSLSAGESPLAVMSTTIRKTKVGSCLMVRSSPTQTDCLNGEEVLNPPRLLRLGRNRRRDQHRQPRLGFFFRSDLPRLGFVKRGATSRARSLAFDSN